MATFCAQHSGHEARIEFLEAGLTSLKNEVAAVEHLNEQINKKFIQIQTTLIMLLVGVVANLVYKLL